jgi:hypothetical protein
METPQRLRRTANSSRSSPMVTPKTRLRSFMEASPAPMVTKERTPWPKQSRSNTHSINGSAASSSRQTPGKKIIGFGIGVTPENSPIKQHHSTLYEEDDGQHSYSGSTIIEENSVVSYNHSRVDQDPFKDSFRYDAGVDFDSSEINEALLSENEFLKNKVAAQEELIAKLSFLVSKQSEHRYSVLTSLIEGNDDQKAVFEQLRLLDINDPEFMAMKVSDHLKDAYVAQRDSVQSKIFQLSLKLDKTRDEHQGRNSRVI